MNRPMDQMEEMDEGQDAQLAEDQGQMLSEEDEQDIDIAIAACLEILDNPEGEQMLQKIMAEPDPLPALSVFLAKTIETVMTGEGGDEINPAVWFAEGGVLDDMSDELDQISGADITSLMPELKQMTLEKVKKMAEVFKSQGAPGAEEPQQPQGPRRPPPVLGVPGG